MARVVEVGQEVTQYVMIHDHHETFSPHIGKLSHSHPHLDNPSDIWLPLSGHQHQGRLSLTERLERASHLTAEIQANNDSPNTLIEE